MIAINVSAIDKDGAKYQVEADFDQQAATNVVYQRHRAAFLAAAHNAVDQLDDDPSQRVHVTVSGSIGWVTSHNGYGERINGFMVSANAWLS